MTTPLLAPPEAQPKADENRPDFDVPRSISEALPKPFRLDIAGLGAAIGLFARLSAANGFGDLDSSLLMLAAALTSAVIGLGLLLMASERDRFGAPLIWISTVTAVSWATLNWISPPFAESVTVWSKPDQAVLALVGFGNGLLLAGLVALAFVRRAPTLTVAATMVAGVAALAANTVLLREEWPSIITLGVAFGLILLAWDRTPRRERTFTVPPDSPRISRAALSFISVAFCGTTLQLWLSRTSIPRSIPAVIVAVVLLGGAFASLVRVRREIERRETTLSEWTSWMREIRTSDFRSEMENFDSDAAIVTFDPRPPVGFDGEAPRPLSFPNLSIPDAQPVLPDTPAVELPSAAGEVGGLPTADVPAAALLQSKSPSTIVPDIVLPTADGPSPAATARAVEVPPAQVAPQPADAASTAPLPAATSGAFSAMLAADPPPVAGVEIADLTALGDWLGSPVAAARSKPLIVAIEAMSLDEYESLPVEDAAMATDEIGAFLADAMPTADLVSWIDGPYFLVAHASKPDSELLELNKHVSRQLKSTNGVLALLRPGAEASLDDLVNEAVMGLLQARVNRQRLA